MFVFAGLQSEKAAKKTLYERTVHW